MQGVSSGALWQYPLLHSECSSGQSCCMQLHRPHLSVYRNLSVNGLKAVTLLLSQKPLKICIPCRTQLSWGDAALAQHQPSP